MSAIQEVIREYKADGGDNEVADQAEAEYAALVEELKNRSAMNAADGLVFIEIMKLLGMDVSGAATTDIPKVLASALDRGEGRE